MRHVTLNEPSPPSVYQILHAHRFLLHWCGCGKWVAPLLSSPTSEKSSTKEAHAPDQFSVSNSCKSLSGWKKHLQELHAHMVGDPPDSQLQLICPSKKGNHHHHKIIVLL